MCSRLWGAEMMALVRWAVFAALTLLSLFACLTVYRFSAFEEPSRERLRPFTFAPSPSVKLLLTFIRSVITSISYASMLAAVLLSVTMAGVASHATTLSVQVGLSRDMGSGLYLRTFDTGSLSRALEIVKGYDVKLLAIRVRDPVELRGVNGSARLLLLGVSGSMMGVFGLPSTRKGVVYVEQSVAQLLGRRVLIGNHSLEVAAQNLEPLLKVYLARGMPLVHSTGAIGFSVVAVRDPKSIALLHAGDILELVKGLRLGIDAVLVVSAPPSYAHKLRGLGELGVVNGTRLTLLTAFMLPTAESMLRVLIASVIAVAVVVSSSSGVTERIARLSSSLSLIGVSPALARLSAHLAVLIPIVVGGAATVVLVNALLGAPAAVSSLLSLSLSVPAAALFISSRIGGAEWLLPASLSTTIAVITHRDPRDVAACMKKHVEADEYFELMEHEFLEAGTEFLTRFRLLYRYSVGIGVEIQCYLARRGRELVLSVLTSAWSLEEVGPRELSSVTRLALSRVLGAARLCMLE